MSFRFLCSCQCASWLSKESKKGITVNSLSSSYLYFYASGIFFFSILGLFLCPVPLSGQPTYITISPYPLSTVFAMFFKTFFCLFLIPFPRPSRYCGQNKNAIVLTYYKHWCLYSRHIKAAGQYRRIKTILYCKTVIFAWTATNSEKKFSIIKSVTA